MTLPEQILSGIEPTETDHLLFHAVNSAVDDVLASVSPDNRALVTKTQLLGKCLKLATQSQ